jgi:hypothetical protein
MRQKHVVTFLILVLLAAPVLAQRAGEPKPG